MEENRKVVDFDFTEEKKVNTYVKALSRKNPKNDLDFYPTPGWATRALFEHVLKHPKKDYWTYQTVWEPAAGMGHMVRVLQEYFGKVYATDIDSYDRDLLSPSNSRFHPSTTDFLSDKDYNVMCDWIITNPPFNKAEEFAIAALERCEKVALLCRLQFLETIGRYNNLWSHAPPSYVAVFSERIGMKKNEVSRRVSSAPAHAWFVWDGYDGFRIGLQPKTVITWIPPCRRDLAEDRDYDD